MNMLLRYFFLKILITLKANKNKLTLDQLINQKISHSYCVLPHDLGWRNHLPNYRYLSFIELNIFSWFTGVDKTANTKLRWLFVAQQMIYLKEVKLFDKFTVNTMLEGWDEKYLYFTHQFFVKGELASVGMTKVMMINSKGKFLPKELGFKNTNITSNIKTWKDNHNAIKTS